MTKLELLTKRISQLNEIGIALSAEKDIDRLLDLILSSAMRITNADGGSLYMMLPDEQRLNLVNMRNKSLGLTMGGATGEEIPFAPIPLYDKNQQPDLGMIVTSAVLSDQTINIVDAYCTEEFDFSGTRDFDSKTGYRSQSFLAVPLKNHENTIIGVLELINSLDHETGQVTHFPKEDQQLTESLASQAAIALTNKNLIDELKNLFDSFIKLIATAIDDKSPYTGMHCKRVPVITAMLAEAADRSTYSALQDFTLDDEKRYELEVASWLHDCGKITTPEHVLDKRTKLETIHDRIELVNARFEIIKQGLSIELQKKKQSEAADQPTPAELADYEARVAALERDWDFIRTCNLGGEFMTDEKKQRIREIAERTWVNHAGSPEKLLTENEAYNLQIAKGTLTAEEREIINSHAGATLKMLDSLPFPKYLGNVPEFAASHHEHLDGSGYPRGLTNEQMSVQAKIIAIADIFEALTDCNRPYRDGMPVSKALRIMGMMVTDGHLDPDLFHVFVEEGVYREYARQYLKKEQLDRVNPEELPSYVK